MNCFPFLVPQEDLLRVGGTYEVCPALKGPVRRTLGRFSQSSESPPRRREEAEPVHMAQHDLYRSLVVARRRASYFRALCL